MRRSTTTNIGAAARTSRSISELAREHPGPILELGAGSGRVTVALARDGHDVVAIRSVPGGDARPATQPRRGAAAGGDQGAREDRPRRSTVVLPCPDVRARGSPRSTRSNTSIRAARSPPALRMCRRKQLAPGGTFAFDVQLPDLAWLDRDPTKLLGEDEVHRPDDQARPLLPDEPRLRSGRPDRAHSPLLRTGRRQGPDPGREAVAAEALPRGARSARGARRISGRPALRRAFSAAAAG